MPKRKVSSEKGKKKWFALATHQLNRMRKEHIISLHVLAWILFIAWRIPI